MNVNYLIIQNKDNNFYHLGILSGSNGYKNDHKQNAAFKEFRKWSYC